MTEQENVQVVQGVYAAFGRGDVASFMDALADDIELVVPFPAGIPNGGTHRGKAGVQEWVGKTVANVRFRVFEPREFIAQGDKVVALLHVEGTIKRTGRDVVAEVAHVWTLRDGKVIRQHSYEETAAVADAYRAQPAPAVAPALTATRSTSLPED